MRLLAACVLSLTVIVVAGCAARGTQRASRAAVEPIEPPHDYDDATVASALVFDPPLLAGDWAPDLARDGRQPSAFLGFDEVTTTYFYLRTDDRQLITDWDGDRYLRRAISEKFGVRYR